MPNDNTSAGAIGKAIGILIGVVITLVTISAGVWAFIAIWTSIAGMIR